MKIQSFKEICKIIVLIFGSVLMLIQCSAKPTYEIVVYGGTSAGVIAAVQSARMGNTVILIEPGKHLGGLTSGGLGKTDTGNKDVIGGVSREFYQRLKKYYDNPFAWKLEKSSDYPGYSSNSDAIWGFEPHVAELIYLQMIEELNIPIVKEERLNLENGVMVKNKKIISIQMESGKQYLGKIFIDATYEGDLMAKAGVSYTIGREANTTYGETLNGVQLKKSVNHNLVDGVDPYVIPGDPSSGLLPGIHGENPGNEGEGDQRIQAYCFRMCLTDANENRLPFLKPAEYDEQRYELLFRNFEAGENGIPWLPGGMPNRKTDTNNRTGFSTDNIGKNYDYPEGNYEIRQNIIKDHEIYQKGLMWVLANHQRIPESIRNEISRWGLAKDEFVDNDNWPHQLYIRESRRMIGEYVITEMDCRRKVIVDDPVGLGSYNMDSHNTQRYVTQQGYAKNEGNIEVSPGGAYLISYRAIVPKKKEIQNLLVPVCLSASHIAYGSIRMEPVFMILAQSAATAAVLALKENCPVQEINYQKLREQLITDKQVLGLPHEDIPF
jgi:hypothetical protein